MRALGVYIFAGAFTSGMRRHAQVEAHLEDKPYPGTDAAKLNFPDIPIYFRSEAPWPVEKFRGVDLVYCNPPCAIFSPIGVSTIRGANAWRTDKRLNCWLRSYSLIEQEPKMLVIESVPQALTRGREMVDALALDALRRGYSVTYLEHDAGVHGAPQRRKRFFFIAHKHELRLRRVNYGPVSTVGEVLATVSDPGWTLPLREDLGAVYPHMRLRANGKWESIRQAWCRERGVNIDARGVPGMPMFMLHRLHENSVAGAFCGNYWLHPSEPRHLGINEMKALCGYDEDFKLSGRPGIAATLLAQAVLPPVGDWVGATAALTLEAGVKIDRPRVEWRDIRRPEEQRRDITAGVIELDPLFPTLVPEDLPAQRAPRSTGDPTRRIVAQHEWLDQQISVLVKNNPRRPGSETYRIYGLYEDGLVVRDFIHRGGRLVDVRHDLERGHIALAQRSAA